MSKKLLSVTIQGKEKTWSFDFYEDPKYIEEWRNDGLVIDEIENTVPVWVVETGLLKPWVRLQDVFNFKNPFK